MMMMIFIYISILKGIRIIFFYKSYSAFTFFQGLIKIDVFDMSVKFLERWIYFMQTVINIHNYKLNIHILVINNNSESLFIL